MKSITSNIKEKIKNQIDMKEQGNSTSVTEYITTEFGYS